MHCAKYEYERTRIANFKNHRATEMKDLQINVLAKANVFKPWIHIQIRTHIYKKKYIYMYTFCFRKYLFEPKLFRTQKVEFALSRSLTERIRTNGRKIKNRLFVVFYDTFVYFINFLSFRRGTCFIFTKNKNKIKK